MTNAVICVAAFVLGGVLGYKLAPDVTTEVAKAKADFAAEKARIKALLISIEKDLSSDVATLRARLTGVLKLF
jgi:hypothetical protein